VTAGHLREQAAVRACPVRFVVASDPHARACHTHGQLSLRTRYELETGSSPASTCSTSAARTGSSNDASFTNPACNRSSCTSGMASRATPGVTSGGRLCNRRSRISAARGSETARARKPRSISASEGGSRSLRLRGSRRVRNRGTPKLAGVPPPSRGTACSGSGRSLRNPFVHGGFSTRGTRVAVRDGPEHREVVGHDDLMTTARTYPHVVADVREIDYAEICE
jgi:hypothetical protein